MRRITRATLHDGHPQGDILDHGDRGESLAENVIAEAKVDGRKKHVTFENLRRRTLGDLAYVVFFDADGNSVSAVQLRPGFTVGGDFDVDVTVPE